MAKAPKRLPRAWSVENILNKKHELLELQDKWYDAFGTPAKGIVWFIWGASGSGKNSFILELIKELSRFGRVIVNDLEEGDAHTVQEAFLRYGMTSVKKKLLWCEEPMADFSERLARPKSPDFVVINSFQYTEMSFKDWLKFKRTHRNKTLIVISQADGKKPLGRPAVSVMYDAALKIYIEGYMARSKGRYFGPNGGSYTIWEEGAADYHGTER